MGKILGSWSGMRKYLEEEMIRKGFLCSVSRKTGNVQLYKPVICISMRKGRMPR